MLAARLHELLDYMPSTGVFLWRVRPARSHVLAGSRAGTLYSNGYRYIQIDGKPYRAARLAWLYVHGVWPVEYVDHINRIKDDDRIANLRSATNSQNQANRSAPRNSASGIKGVRWQADRSKWGASITEHGKKRNLGRFDTKEEAERAYLTAAQAAFGQFA